LKILLKFVYSLKTRYIKNGQVVKKYESKKTYAKVTKVTNNKLRKTNEKKWDQIKHIGQNINVTN